MLHSNSGEAFVVSTETSSVGFKTMTLYQAPLRYRGNLPQTETACVSSSLKFEARRLRIIGGKLDSSSQCHDIVLKGHRLL